MFSESLESVRRIFVYVFVALVAVFIGVSFFLDVRVTGIKNMASITINDSRIRLIKNGKVKIEFSVDHITLSPDEKKYEFRKVHDGLFNRTDKPPVSFSAAAGSYDSRAEKLNLSGNFNMESKNGDYFKANSADWDGVRKQLSIPTQVAFSVDGNVIQAGSLEVYGDDLTIFNIRKDVIVKIEDIKKTGGKETEKELKETNLEESYFKKLTLRAQLVQYDRIEKSMKCYAVDSTFPIFMPGQIQAPPKITLVSLDGRNFTLKSHEMNLDIERKSAQATGQVWALRKGEKKTKDKSKFSRAFMKSDTVFETEQATLFWKEGFIDFPYAVAMTKKDLNGYAGRGFVDIKHNTAVLDMGVNMHQKKGDWLIDEGVVDKDSSKKVKDAVREDSTIVCENIDMDFDSDNLNAFGNVNITQKNRLLSGGSAHYDGEKKSWSVFENSFYKDKDYRILADRFIYYEREKIFEAQDNVAAEKQPNEDQRKDLSDYFEDRDGAPPDEKSFSRENVKVTAKKIHYDEKKDTLRAEGGARLFFKDVIVHSDKLFVDYGADTANADGDVSFDDPRNHITAASLDIAWKNKRLEASGDVRLRDAGRKAEGDRDEQESFNMSSRRLVYDWKNKKGTATGGVKIIAEERTAAADTALFDRKEKTFRLIGSVKIHQDSGNWLEKRDVFDEKDEKARKLAGKPTDITCAEAFLDDGKDRVKMTGGVKIVQPHMVVTADSIDADSKHKIFEASGDVVYSQDSGDWLFDEKFIDEDVEEDVEKRFRKSLTITTDHLISEYGEDKIFVDGGVKLTEGQNSASADRIWHYGESKRTVFEGKVSFLDDRGRDFTAERVIYDRATKTVEAFKGIKGSSDLNELKKNNKQAGGTNR